MDRDSDPKRGAGQSKPPVHFIPGVAEVMVGLALETGASKYGPFNWRKESISITTYIGAIRRHASLMLDGELIDRESGLPHWAHIAASAMIAMDADAIGKLINDLPPRGGVPNLMAKVTAHRKAVAEGLDPPYLWTGTEMLTGDAAKRAYIESLNKNAEEVVPDEADKTGQPD